MNYHSKISNKRFYFWIIVSVLLLVFFVLGLYYGNTSPEGESRVFSAVLRFDSENDIYYWSLATFQYFTWTCFFIMLVYYWLLLFTFTLSKYLFSRDTKIFRMLVGSSFKNAMVSMFVAMFLIVIIFLGPYSLFGNSENTNLATTPEGNVISKSLANEGNTYITDPTSGVVYNVWEPRNSLIGSISTTMIHLVFPILVIFENFFWKPVNKSGYGSWIYWLIPFLVYMSYTFPISFSLTNELGTSMYPYFFFDPSIVGIHGVILLSLLLLILGFLLFWIQWKVSNNNFLKSIGEKNEPYNIKIDIKNFYEFKIRRRN